MNSKEIMRSKITIISSVAVLLFVFVGCNSRPVPDKIEYAYFDGKLTLTDTGSNIFVDRANFVKFIVTDSSAGRLKPVMETMKRGDSTANTRWIEFYGSVAPKDTIMGYDMMMYITVDSLLDFGPSEGKDQVYMVGAYEFTMDTMKYQFRVLPNYTYVLGEFARQRDVMLSKKGKWKRTGPYTLLFNEEERVFRYDNEAEYESWMTPSGEDSARYNTMRFVFDPEADTLIEKDSGKIVFWRVYL